MANGDDLISISFCLLIEMLGLVKLKTNVLVFRNLINILLLLLLNLVL